MARFKISIHNMLSSILSCCILTVCLPKFLTLQGRLAVSPNSMEMFFSECKKWGWLALLVGKELKTG